MAYVLTMEHGVRLTWAVEGVDDRAWHVVRAQLREGIDEPYELRLTLQADPDRTEPERMLGKRGQLELAQGQRQRTVHGIVCEVEAESERNEGRMRIALVVRPALDALRYRVDSRIFQGKTVPEILEEVLTGPLTEWGSELDPRLTRRYPTHDYRVQYRETDLDFARRLMEEEGISFFFDRAGSSERMVLVDGPDQWAEIPGPLPYSDRAVDAHAAMDTDAITDFTVASRLRPTKLATRHVHWRTPSIYLEGEDDSPSDTTFRDGASVEGPREEYDHEHRPLTTAPDGASYGEDEAVQRRLRRDAQRRDARSAVGRSAMLSIESAATFELTGHSAFDLDGEYLVVSVTHEVSRGGSEYSNAFACLPRATAYGPRRVTPKPRMPSVQTGVVVGPSGEEIHTDEHGRIKVQLPWDRQGAMDEHASCWMRVRQPWAGSGWGFVFIPRIGMEVVVDFLNGDPDRPLVLGCVYNGEHLVPYALPDEKTKSTIKTESSLGGGGFNELRFEDLAGSEEIFIHAQKDFNEVVENDHTTTVHHDQKIRVDEDQAQEVGNDQTEHVFANVNMTVDANRTVAVHGSFTETIDGSHTRLVSSGVTETIDAGETRTVTGGMTEDITGDRTQSITGASTETITGSLAQSITGGATISTPGAFNLTALGGLTITAAGGTRINTNTYTLVAPAGNTHHDQWWKFFARSWTDNFAWKLDVTPNAIEVCGIKMSFNSGFYLQSKGLAGGAFALRSKTWTINGDSSAEKTEAKAIDADLKAAGLRA